MKRILARVVLSLTLFAFVPSVFAQTITPTPSVDQSATVAKESLSTQTPAETNQVLVSTNQQAVDALPQPTILPDSPFYFLKRWGENIQTFFTIDDYQRAQLQLHFAQVRLGEAKTELEKNNTHLSDQALEDYNKAIQRVSTTTQKLAEEGREVTNLIDTIKDREQTRLALLNRQLAKTTDPERKKQIENSIAFITRQSQTNINRLIHAITQTPTYKPSPYQTVSGQVTGITAPSFTVQMPNGKSTTFATDSTTSFKLFGTNASGSFAQLTVGSYVRVTFPRATTTPTPTPTGTLSGTPLAKTVIIGVPQTLIVPLVGTIANFALNSFTLQTANGAYIITVDMNTTYHSNRDDASARAIHDGTRVRIYAVPQTANTFLAKTIYVELPKKISRGGEVTAIQGSTITVTAPKGMAYTFTLTNATLVQKNGQPASSTDLALGERVTIRYEGSPTDTNANAIDINIYVPARPKRTVTPTGSQASPSSTVSTISPTPTR